MAKYNSCAAVTLNSIDATCDESRASIKRVLVCPKEDIEVIGYQYEPVDSPNNELFEKSTLINNLVLANNKKFVEFKFRRNTGSYTSTYTGDNTTGSQVVTTEVTLQFSKAENQKRLEFQKLTGHPCVMLIEDAYGKYIALGVDAPVVLTNTVMQSGTAKSDLSGFTLTFTEESNIFPPFVKNYYSGDVADVIVVDDLLDAILWQPETFVQSQWVDSGGGAPAGSSVSDATTITLKNPDSIFVAVKYNEDDTFIKLDFKTGYNEYTFSVNDTDAYDLYFIYGSQDAGFYYSLPQSRALKISFNYTDRGERTYVFSNIKAQYQAV